MILLGQLQDELAGHDERLLVGQGDGLACLDGMDGGREAGEADHGGEHHVDGACLHDFVEGTRSGIHFHVGQVVHEAAQLVVVLLVGDDDGGGAELMGLLGQQRYAVVGGEAIDFVEVAVLLDDLEGLRAYGAGGAENGYLSFLHISNNPSGMFIVMVFCAVSMWVMRSSTAGMSRPSASSKRVLAVLSSMAATVPTG